MYLEPPPSVVELVKDNIQSDAIWKKWLNNLFVFLTNPLYANIYVDGNTTETVITTQLVAVQITDFNTNGASNELVPDHSNDHITITETGDYHINMSLSLDGVGGTSSTFRASAYINNGATEIENVHCSTEISSGTDVEESMSGSGIWSLTEDDTLEVWILNSTGTQNIIVEDVSLTAILLKRT